MSRPSNTKPPSKRRVARTLAHSEMRSRLDCGTRKVTQAGTRRSGQGSPVRGGQGNGWGDRSAHQCASRKGQDHISSGAPAVATFGPSQFAGAHSFNIQNQTIITSQVGSSKALFEHLDPHIVHGAVHNSNDHRNAPTCHEETRIAIRGNIIGWIKNNEGGGDPKLMWLSGPAGAGKSAIAGAIAETCEDEGLLAASFFFSAYSRSVGRCSSRGLIATLVHQISQHRALAQFKERLLRSIEDRPDIFHKCLRDQAKHLILEPFREILERGDNDRSCWPTTVIIDGVDEVVVSEGSASIAHPLPTTAEDHQVEVLDVLLSLCRSRFFPFRIFVTSRPEKHITDFFREAKPHCPTIALFLDSKYDPDTDIRRFLESRFAQVRRRSGPLEPSWPGRSAVDSIVDMSSGQFIVATTIIRWVEAGIPKKQLDDVLKLQHSMSKKPLSTLDTLYHHILARAPNPDEDPNLVVKWIRSMASGGCASPLDVRNPNTPVAFWRCFFEDVEGEFAYRMAPLTSLVSTHVPDNSCVEIYHKSLVDYLLTPNRCEALYVDDGEMNSFICMRIVKVLKNIPQRLYRPPDETAASDFLLNFLSLNMVRPRRSVSESDIGCGPPFLSYLEEEDVYLLASCDVTWWTRLCLRSQGGPVDFIRRIYFSIHQDLGCDLRQDLGAGQALLRSRESKCYEACVNWRTGILAEAKSLGWCVHMLEKIPLRELHNVGGVEARIVFSPLSRQKCLICAEGGRCN